ncbi:MAG: LptF/LptG family permease [bacterium]
MKILYKYILKEIIKSFILIISAIVLFILISNLLDETPLMLRFRPPLILVINYFLFKLPFLATEALPSSMLLSILYVFSQLNRTNELNAIKSAGVDFFSVIKPILAFALIVSLGSIIINETLVSRAYEKAEYIKDVLIEKKGNASTEIRQDLAKLSSGGKVFYIKYFDGLIGLMRGVCILTIDNNFNIVERLDAREGTWDKDKWLLKDTVIRNFSNSIETKVNKFSLYTLQVKDAPEDFVVRKKSPEDTLTVNIFRLNKLIKLLKESGFNAGEEETNLHLKLAFPFATFIFALLGISIPFMFSTTRSFLNAALGFITTIIISFFYMGFVTIGLSLGKVAVMPPILAAWMANIIFICLGFVVLMKVKR